MKITTAEEFVKLWQEMRSCSAIAKHLNTNVRDINKKRRKVEETLNIKLETHTSEIIKPYKGRIDLGVLNGVVIVFSDAHFWGQRTTAFQGLLWLIEELKPHAVIANGDIFDGAGISRHPAIMWSKVPSVKEELAACLDAMGEIERCAKDARHNVKLIWPLGNHDARFENFLAANASQYGGVTGFSLRDHFPAWEPCWAAWINSETVVKHRYKGGIHATHNNTVNAGINIVTGHLHSLKVTPFSDYRGVRYGVDTGCLADADGPQFQDYLEHNPTNWRSGFAVLSFFDGKILVPELCQKWSDGKVQFRGTVFDVSEF
jgi:hypothetical protein